LFKDFPELLSNQAHVPDLSQRAIIAFLSAPTEVKQEIKDKLEAGEAISASEIRRLKLANESLKQMSDNSMKEVAKLAEQKEAWRKFPLLTSIGITWEGSHLKCDPLDV